MIGLCRVGFAVCWVAIYVLACVFVASVCNGEFTSTAAVGGGLCALAAGQNWLSKVERVVRRRNPFSILRAHLFLATKDRTNRSLSLTSFYVSEDCLTTLKHYRLREYPLCVFPEGGAISL